MTRRFVHADEAWAGQATWTSTQRLPGASRMAWTARTRTFAAAPAPEPFAAVGATPSQRS
jgi:hypothetical protein